MILIIILILLILIFKIEKFEPVVIDNYELAYLTGKKFLEGIQNNMNNMNNQGVMFDIDDTLFDYSQHEIKSIINLLLVANNLGFKIIIITARSYENIFDETIELLKNIPYDIIYLRTADDLYDTFKSDIKKYINEVLKIEIVLSVGDSWIDVNGEYSGEYIKLPNKQDLYTKMYMSKLLT
jgi:hypothetical protein